MCVKYLGLNANLGCSSAAGLHSGPIPPRPRASDSAVPRPSPLLHVVSFFLELGAQHGPPSRIGKCTSEALSRPAPRSGENAGAVAGTLYSLIPERKMFGRIRAFPKHPSLLVISYSALFPGQSGGQPPGPDRSGQWRLISACRSVQPKDH